MDIGNLATFLPLADIGDLPNFPAKLGGKIILLIAGVVLIAVVWFVVTLITAPDRIRRHNGEYREAVERERRLEHEWDVEQTRSAVRPADRNAP